MGGTGPSPVGILPGASPATFYFEVDMAKFRKKPVVIEAFCMGVDARPDWFQDKVTGGSIVTHALEDNGGDPFQFVKTCCDIQTLEGTMRGNYGDYIIRGVQGEVYPCKPDIFLATYEPVE